MTLTLNDLPQELLKHMIKFIPSVDLVTLALVSRRLHNLVNDAWNDRFYEVFVANQCLSGDKHILQDCIDHPEWPKALACQQAEERLNFSCGHIPVDAGVLSIAPLSEDRVVFGSRAGGIGIVSCGNHSELKYDVLPEPVVQHWITSIIVMGSSAVSAISTEQAVHLLQICPTGLRVKSEWGTKTSAKAQLASDLIWVGCRDGFLRTIDPRCEHIVFEHSTGPLPISCLEFASKESKQHLLVGSDSGAVNLYDIRRRGEIQVLQCSSKPRSVIGGPLGAIITDHSIQRVHISRSGCEMKLDDDKISCRRNNKAIMHNGCLVLLSRIGEIKFINPYSLRYFLGDTEEIEPRSLQLMRKNTSVEDLWQYDSFFYDVSSFGNSLWLMRGTNMLCRLYWPIRPDFDDTFV